MQMQCCFFMSYMKLSLWSCRFSFFPLCFIVQHWAGWQFPIEGSLISACNIVTSSSAGQGLDETEQTLFSVVSVWNACKSGSMATRKNTENGSESHSFKHKKLKELVQLVCLRQQIQCLASIRSCNYIQNWDTSDLKILKHFSEHKTPQKHRELERIYIHNYIT